MELLAIANSFFGFAVKLLFLDSLYRRTSVKINVGFKGRYRRKSLLGEKQFDSVAAGYSTGIQSTIGTMEEPNFALNVLNKKSMVKEITRIKFKAEKRVRRVSFSKGEIGSPVRAMHCSWLTYLPEAFSGQT